MRRGRRPARLPQLGQRRPRRRSRARVERRADPDPALRAADPRDADLPLRGAGLDPVPVDHRHEPGGLAARAAADPLDPRPGAALRRRPGHLPHRDRAVRRRRPAGRHLGREDRHLHQRRPHGAPVGEGGRATGRGEAGPRHLPRLRPPPRARGQGRRPAGEVVGPRGRVRGLEGVQPRAALRLHRAHLRQAARRQRHPVAVHRRAPRRNRTALRGRPLLGRCRLLRGVRPRHGDRRRRCRQTEYKALNPDGKAVLKAAEYLPPHELPERGVTRSS